MEQVVSTGTPSGFNPRRAGAAGDNGRTEALHLSAASQDVSSAANWARD